MMRRHAALLFLALGLAWPATRSAAAMDRFQAVQPAVTVARQQGPAVPDEVPLLQSWWGASGHDEPGLAYAACREVGGGCGELGPDGGQACGGGGNPCEIPACCQPSPCGDCRCRRRLFFDAWLAQGFTGNPDDPADGFNGPVTFNDRANEYQMNQLYLSFGRKVDAARFAWDIGGRVDLLYGTDYFFTTATGLETHQDGSPQWNSEDGPRGGGAALYGLAMPQVYAEVFAPIGRGLTVKMGHFYTILGHESVMAPENYFYSHSYSMQYGEPFTHTGLLGTYHAADRLKFHAGFTRGWDTWEDPNNTLGVLAGLTWTSPDRQASLALAAHVGNEDPAGERTRAVYSLVFSRCLTSRLKYVIQHDLGVDEDAAAVGGRRVDGRWYSINQYLIYQLNPTTSLGLRVEWFRDENSTRVFAPPADLVEGSDYTELTLGMNWKPSEHLVVRPEVRWDWSGVSAPALGAEGVFDDFSKKNQFLLGLDVIVRR